MNDNLNQQEFKGMASTCILHLIMWGIIIFLISFCGRAQADARPYVMLGQAQYKILESGTWYINELPHSIHNKAPAWSMGIRGDNYRIGWFDFGGVKSDALAYWPDAAYQKEAPQGCAALGCAPANRYIGIFKMDGLVLAYEPQFAGPLNLQYSAGIGIGYFRHDYKERISYTAGPNPYIHVGDQAAGETDMPFCGESICHSPRWRAAYTLSIGVTGKNIGIYFLAVPKAYNTEGIFKGVAALFLEYRI